MVYDNFQKAYIDTVKNVYNNGEKITVRGNEMLEVIPGYFEIKNPRDRLLNLSCRKGIKKYIFGELLWYLSGRDDLNFINKYSSAWKPLSDDGVHCNSAYGKYIFGDMPKIGYGSYYDGSYKKYLNYMYNYNSQWDYVKEVLKKDPSSRQAVIHIKPIQMYDTKDVTCTYFLQFFIRNNKLDLVVGMRSNDLLYGTTYDVFMFTFMQELMAAELGIELGTYKHFASNMHIYLKDEDTIKNILSEDAEADTFKFDSIPSNFREHDLPLLLKLESMYDKHNYDYLITCSEYDKISNVSKQLIDLLR